MSSTYTPETLHHLLLHTVAPAFADRRAADQLLFSLSVGSGEATNAVLTALFDEATDRFGDRLRPFLEDLTHFWMDACARCVAARMAQWEKSSEPAWSVPAHTPTFAMQDSCTFGEWDLFGMGIGAYLDSQAQRLGFLIPLLIRGLSHPEPTVSDKCWDIAARHPDAAAATFPAMWAVACAKGPWFSANQPMRGLAAIVDAYPPALDTVKAVFATSDSDDEIKVASQVVTHLSRIPPSLVDAVESAFSRLDSDEQRAALFITLTRIAAFATAAQRDAWLARAVKMASGPSEALRAAAAWACVRLGTPASNETVLLSLLEDADWWPRRDACLALAEWSSPSPAIVDAVARRLGDYDGYDGDPHATALQTLTQWKAASTPALPVIAAWLDRTDYESGEIRAEPLLELIESIGESARVLRPQIERFLAECDRAEQRAGEESGDDEDPEQQFGAAWDAVIDHFSAGMGVPEEIAAELKGHEGLREDFRNALSGDGDDGAAVPPIDVNAFAERLGIDAGEDIPGTRTSAELAAEPDAGARLRTWLAAVSQT